MAGKSLWIGGQCLAIGGTDFIYPASGHVVEKSEQTSSAPQSAHLWFLVFDPFFWYSAFNFLTLADVEI